jgi:hypothetical protein
MLSFGMLTAISGRAINVGKLIQFFRLVLVVLSQRKNG